MNRTSNPYGAFFALASRLKLDDQMRMSLVRQFSKDRTASLKELNGYEYAELVGYLNRQAPQPPKGEQKASPSPVWESANAMRGKIFFLFRELGFCWGSSTEDKARNAMVVKHYVIKYGYLKCKSLNDYTIEELPKLVSQFQNWKKNVDKAEARRAVKELCKELNIQSNVASKKV